MTLALSSAAPRANAPGAPPGAPLRILLVNSFLPPRGGAEAHVEMLQELLQRAGHAVEVLVPGPAAPWRALCDRFYNAGFGRELRRRIATFRPDVIHVHNFLRRMGVAPFLAAREQGVPLLLTVHDFQLFCPRTWAVRADGTPCSVAALPRCALGACRGSLAGLHGRVVYAGNALRRWWAARVVRRTADCIVAPSRALADRLARALQRDVEVLPYPFPAPCPSPLPATSDILFLGRIASEKGLRELLLALGRVGGELRLTVAGDGPQRQPLEQLTRSLGLDHRVRFTGWVDRARAAELLRDHAALVVPSVWLDNSPLVVHEALAAGRPVLGSRRGGIPELVEDGKTGLLFEPLDPVSIDAALRRWQALAPAARTAMASAAPARAADAGGSSGFLDRLLAIYRAMLARKARS